MAERIYTTGEMDEAQRLVQAIASIADDDKRNAFIRVVESMLLGAQIAERHVERPGA